ncbi:hypothetical protein KUCAC02_031864, partial [Chaenocephalus aceratus]
LSLFPVSFFHFLETQELLLSVSRPQNSKRTKPAAIVIVADISVWVNFQVANGWISHFHESFCRRTPAGASAPLV